MVLVSVSASAHHRLVFHVTATNAHIKFILNTDDREWKNPIDFGKNRKTKMADADHFVKYDEKLVYAITSSEMHRSTSYLM